MRPTAIAEILKSRIEDGNPRTILVTSAPGSGKTQVLQQVAAQLNDDSEDGFGCLTVHAPTLDPADVALPLPNLDRTAVNYVATSNVLPFDDDDSIPDRGLLIIDEMPQAANDVQKLMAQLIQERTVFGKKLKKGWTIVATGNRQQDKAGANKVLKHLADRMTTLEMDVSIEDWTNWFVKQPYFSPTALAFVNFRPGLLSDFNPDLDVSPTPRSWAEGVFRSMDTVPMQHALDVFKGDVGEGAAAEFVSFLAVFKTLPDIDKILKSPGAVATPAENNTKYAVIGALAAKVNAKNFGNALQYATKMGPEYGVLMVRSAKAVDPDLVNTKAFTDWALSDGQNVLLA